MKTIVDPAREIPVIATPDVLVTGAGPAGIGAAIAAARNGAKVLLVERYGFLGGNLTIAMVNPMFTFHDVHGRQVIRGIAGEIVDRLVELTGAPGHVTDLTFDNASMTPFDPEGMKYLLFEMVHDAGVELLLHTWVVDAIARDGKVESIIIENKSGRQAIQPKLVIDCSADGDIAAKVGAPFNKGRETDGLMQPVTLFFRIGGIDDAGLRQWMKQNRDLLKDSPTDEEIDRQDAIALLGMNDLVKAAMASGEFPAEAAPRILLYRLPIEGQAAVNCTRLQGIDGTNAQDLTRAEILTRKQAWQIHRFLRARVGGFEHSHILDTGIQVGVRETRHIIGDYMFTEDDVLGGHSFADGIACGTFAIDIHPPDGQEQIFSGSGKSVYEIPYRSCTPLGFDNLLVAGRCISATHAAFGSARVMATCVGIGQGVGTAAAFAVREGKATRQVDVAAVRTALIEQGQYLLDDRAEIVHDDRLKLTKAGGSGTRAAHHNPFEKSQDQGD